MTTRPHDDLRDERFDEAWRRASNEEPPAALDDAIRAAARREIGVRPRDLAKVPEATSPERWWFPIAAAAVIGAVAIGLLQLSTPERVAPEESRAVSDTPAGAKPIPTAPAAPAKADATAAPPPAASAESKPAPPRRQQAAPARDRPEPKAFPAPPQEQPRPAEAPQPAAARGADETPSEAPAHTRPAERTPQAERAPAKSEATAVGAAVPAPPMSAAPRAAAKHAAGHAEAPDALAKERATMPVAEWIAMMRRLKDEGRADELAKELAAFRSAHADADALLPPELRNVQPAPR